MLHVIKSRGTININNSFFIYNWILVFFPWLPTPIFAIIPPYGLNRLSDKREDIANYLLILNWANKLYPLKFINININKFNKLNLINCNLRYLRNWRGSSKFWASRRKEPKIREHSGPPKPSPWWGWLMSKFDYAGGIAKQLRIPTPLGVVGGGQEIALNQFMQFPGLGRCK